MTRGTVTNAFAAPNQARFIDPRVACIFTCQDGETRRFAEASTRQNGDAPVGPEVQAPAAARRQVDGRFALLYGASIHRYLQAPKARVPAQVLQ